MKESQMSKNYNFTELLNEYDRVLIPMIQRDYAQGRDNKKVKNIRETLLHDIFSNKKISFDLIFGTRETRIIDSESKNCFIPVDGQQRLTTLFLLYLYYQKKDGKKEIDLAKFTYDTRKAANDFCFSVVNEDWNVGKTPSDEIMNAVWFMEYWKKDPTVEGMLNMLDEIHDFSTRYKQPNLDNITFYFYDLAEGIVKDGEKNTTQENKSLSNKGLNENIYLKMNSRGKPLTAFENLKAKLDKAVSEIKAKYDGGVFPDDENAPKSSFSEQWKYYIDRAWYNSFWDSENPEKCDRHITAFIVRFLSGYFEAFGGNGTEKTKNALKDLNTEENYDDFIPFTSINEVLKLEHSFKRLACALTEQISIQNILPKWNASEYSSKSKSEYKSIAVVFSYLIFKELYSDDEMKRALRFTWNMVENTVDGYDSFISFCKHVKEIFTYSKNSNFGIYETLSKKKFSNPSDQLPEEIAKAKQIIDENGVLRKYEGSSKKEDNSEYKTWEEIIIAAENYAFFRGAIRFLFTDGKGNINWNDFDKKWENAQKYFKPHLTSEDYSVMNADYNNANLLKSLLSHFNDNNFWSVLWWSRRVFNNSAITWRYYLLNKAIFEPIHQIMMSATSLLHRKESEDLPENTLYQLSNTKLLDFVIKTIPASWIRWYHNHLAIFPSSTGVFLNAEKRDNFLLDCEKVEVDKKCKIPKTKLLFGSDINFTYKKKNFQWYRNDYIYLMEDDNQNEYEIRNSKAKAEEKIYYCFLVDENDDEKTILKNLDSLIFESKSSGA